MTNDRAEKFAKSATTTVDLKAIKQKQLPARLQGRTHLLTGDISSTFVSPPSTARATGRRG